MNFVKHPSNTTTLRPAAGDEATVGVLPVTVSKADNGDRMVTSFWKPDDSERRALADGHLIMLHAFGTVHPPVMLQVEAGAPTARKLSMEAKLAAALEAILTAQPPGFGSAHIKSAQEHNAHLEGHRVIREYRASVGQ